MMLFKYGESSEYKSDIPIAVIGIVMKVFSIVINIVIGIILGAQPILGYNYGAKKINRVKETFKKVAIMTLIIGVASTFIIELYPQKIISIFGSNDTLYINFAVLAFRLFLMFITFTCFIKVSSIFFQAVGSPIKSAIISLGRDIIFFVPLVIILPNFWGINGVLISAPIADCLGMFLTIALIINFFKNLDIENTEIEQKNIYLKKSHPGVIITISRTHGTKGKKIAKLVAQKLNIPYYDKEITALVAKESGLDKEFISNISNSNKRLYDLYLTTSPVKYAIEAQEKIIKKIALNGSCVIVGRASDYVLRNNDKVIKIFIYAPLDYRIKNIMKMYNDSLESAKKNIALSDKNRANYYEIISNQTWGQKENYDLCINSYLGEEQTANIICDYIEKLKK